MHCIPVIVLQTNKADAQCDKLATELSSQRFTLQVANFQLLYHTCICHLCWGWPRLSFAQIFGIRKLRVPGLSCGVVCVLLHLAVSVEHWLVTDIDTWWQLMPMLASIAWVIKYKDYVDNVHKVQPIFRPYGRKFTVKFRHFPSVRMEINSNKSLFSVHMDRNLQLNFENSEI